MKNNSLKGFIRNIKIRTKIILVLILIFIVWIIIIQFQTYKYPDSIEINKRLNYLEQVIQEPLNNNSEIALLGYESNEFMLFSYSFSTYAFTNLAIKDSTYKYRVAPLIRECITKVLDNRISSPYNIDSSFIEMDSIPDYSVLYLGHLNLMLGCHRLLSNDTTFNKLNDKISSSLFRRYSQAKFMNLESYPSSIWIADNSVAIASLKLHSNNTRSQYSSICSEWVNYIKRHYIEKEVNVLYSTINAKTGKPIEEPRGSMLGWCIMFIYQFDSDFATNLYNDYKAHFSSDFLIFRLFKERFNNSKTNSGDIDSGPIFWGYSIPANEFALGGAVLSGDFKTARKIERLISFGTSKDEKGEKLKYNVRFVNMNISPMAEVLVLNSLTITKWTDQEIN